MALPGEDRPLKTVGGNSKPCQTLFPSLKTNLDWKPRHKISIFFRTQWVLCLCACVNMHVYPCVCVFACVYALYLSCCDWFLVSVIHCSLLIPTPCCHSTRNMQISEVNGCTAMFTFRGRSQCSTLPTPWRLEAEGHVSLTLWQSHVEGPSEACS